MRKLIAIRAALSLGLMISTLTNASAQMIDHTNNSKYDDVIITQNRDWGPVAAGTVLRMTDKHPDEVSVAYYKTPVNITKFSASFMLCFYPASADESNCSDGMTFIIQNTGPKALGNGGGQLGYGGIGKSVAVKFDTFANQEFAVPEPSDATIGLYKNGEVPYGGVDVSVNGINFRSHDPMQVALDYNGKTLQLHMVDVMTQAAVSRSFPVDIPDAVGGPRAYVGFTAACGDGCSGQEVLRWKFTSQALPETKPIVKDASAVAGK